jgi:hypothetical protein
LAEIVNHDPSESGGAGLNRTDIAFRRYDAILRYLASDNAIFLNRSQVILVANAALLGFWGNQLKDIPVNLSGVAWYVVAALLVESLVGIWICVVWHFAIDAGVFWMDRWQKILEEKLEAEAFGSIDVYRNISNRPKPRSRTMARMLQMTFLVFWILALFLSAYLSYIRATQN